MGLGGKYLILSILIFWLPRERRREREREPSFFPRSSKLRQSNLVKPRTKVHCIDEGYKYIPEMRDFAEDPKEEISGNQRFQAGEANYPCFYTSRGRDSSYLGLLSSFGLRKKGFFVLGNVWVNENGIFKF